MIRNAKRVNSTLAYLCVVFVLFACRALPAAEPVKVARTILDRVERPVGLAHLPRCGDGKLALALLDADSRLMVHGQDADYGQVQSARKQADEKGVFGRRA